MDINNINQTNNKKIKKKLKNITSESIQLGILLAIVGGFLDSYTFIGRGGVFANTQTGNIVLLGIDLAKGDLVKMLVHIPPILAFVVGVAVVELIKNYLSHPSLPGFAQIVIIIEIVLLFIIGFVPYSVPNIIVTVAISFVASVQVTSFSKLVDSPYSNTMCTGNLRSASQAAFSAIIKKDSESAKRAIRYFLIIISFLIGAFLGAFLTINLGVKAIWIAVLILVCTVVLFNIDERK